MDPSYLAIPMMVVRLPMILADSTDVMPIGTVLAHSGPTPPLGYGRLHHAQPLLPAAGDCFTHQSGEMLVFSNGSWRNLHEYTPEGGVPDPEESWCAGCESMFVGIDYLCPECRN